jgi:D-alanine-D-alanine ligase-like ATP-grasp enzyme
MFVVWILWQRFNAALKDNGGVILEVNAAPGFRMHLASEGLPRNVAAPVIDIFILRKIVPNSDYRSNWY